MWDVYKNLETIITFRDDESKYIYQVQYKLQKQHLNLNYAMNMAK